MSYMKYLHICLLLLLSAIRCLADEGMWLPVLLEKLNEKEMKAMGMKISAKDIYNINNGSLKDAIVQFGGGCTGEIVSNKGLLITNHHCGFGSIQRLSSLTYNYLRDGYWAKNISEELPCAGLTVTFISRMADVSKEMLEGITPGMSESERQAQIEKNMATVKQNAGAQPDEELLVRPFYNGNQYYLFYTITFRDIRLVGAPPSSIGAFGADTDNWVWPRHGGDFSMFRIYANRENRPASYSSSNIPYVPKRSLSISLDGVQEGDFTMVFGFPGRTTQYLPSNAVQQTGAVLNPVKIAIRDAALKTMRNFMQADEQIKIQYAAKYSGIANAWKKWIGESQGLAATDAVGKKRKYEAEFMKRINAKPALKAKYGTVLQQLNQLYTDIEPYALVRDHYGETVNNCEILDLALDLSALLNAYDKSGEAGWTKEKEALLGRLPAFYKDYQPKVDQQVLAKLMEMYFKNVNPEHIGQRAIELKNLTSGDMAALASTVFTQSNLMSLEKMKALLAKPAKEAVVLIYNDNAFQLADGLADGYSSLAAQKINDLQPQINSLQRQYMQAQLEAFPEKRFYPDANSTLRVTYGKVKGYKPRDGVEYGYYTYLDGVMEKYVPGDYEFDVPAKLLDLHKRKDYGQYATADGRMPVAFIAANHTTGGNSGSPALDAYGNFVGLNFDRVWEGTMSDINYDVNICRNIMVDVRYILFIIDKLGGASHLIKEMNLVHPKKK
jgi:hypothetical protein